MATNVVKTYSSIVEIPAELWDSILLPLDVFHTHRFIHTVELAKVENSQCWPVCFYEKDELVATAVLSAFRVDLGLFLGERMSDWIRSVRKRIPHFLQPKILFCGLPISLGQKNLIIARPESTNWVLKALDEKMQEIASRYELGFFILKEFDQESAGELGAFKGLGYFIGDSIPYMNMDIRWTSFDAYLNELRHTYRRQVKKSLKKIAPISPEAPAGIVSPLQAMVRFNHWENCPPSLFYNYYLKVMDRAETKLEVLNLPFFEHCFEKLREDLTLITVEKGGEVLSAGLLFKHDPYLTFALVGNKYGKHAEVDPYFNLIHAMIALAIKEDVQQLKLGQTAYWVKQRLGGKPSGRILFFKAKNRVTHYALKKMRKILFPDTPIPSIHVFKKQA
ncbi:peptidogalycan biosysnthesis protein [Neolewinella persica]|uniref:peptidogalycan biosysnthesis protein n=1 Tax=Neolewinella persica TaxID=70998 RepID=UPI0003738C9F|nr:peptidogalycan biosysnthesis protein [Neolewinella persica]